MGAQDGKFDFDVGRIESQPGRRFVFLVRGKYGNCSIAGLEAT